MRGQHFRVVRRHEAHDQLGAPEAGKFADLTILEKDPYAVDPDALMSIKLSQTWVGGRKMFG